MLSATAGEVSEVGKGAAMDEHVAVQKRKEEEKRKEKKRAKGEKEKREKGTGEVQGAPPPARFWVLFCFVLIVFPASHERTTPLHLMSINAWKVAGRNGAARPFPPLKKKKKQRRECVKDKCGEEEGGTRTREDGMAKTRQAEEEGGGKGQGRGGSTVQGRERDR